MYSIRRTNGKKVLKNMSPLIFYVRLFILCIYLFFFCNISFHAHIFFYLISSNLKLRKILTTLDSDSKTLHNFLPFAALNIVCIFCYLSSTLFRYKFAQSFYVGYTLFSSTTCLKTAL